MTPINYFEIIPTECTLHILSYCQGASLARLERTCRSMRKIIEGNSILYFHAAKREFCISYIPTKDEPTFKLFYSLFYTQNEFFCLHIETSDSKSRANSDAFLGNLRRQITLIDAMSEESQNVLSKILGSKLEGQIQLFKLSISKPSAKQLILNILVEYIYFHNMNDFTYGTHGGHTLTTLASEQDAYEKFQNGIREVTTGSI